MVSIIIVTSLIRSNFPLLVGIENLKTAESSFISRPLGAPCITADEHDIKWSTLSVYGGGAAWASFCQWFWFYNSNQIKILNSEIIGLKKSAKYPSESEIGIQSFTLLYFTYAWNNLQRLYYLYGMPKMYLCAWLEAKNLGVSWHDYMDTLLH